MLCFFFFFSDGFDFETGAPENGGSSNWSFPPWTPAPPTKPYFPRHKLYKAIALWPSPKGNALHALPNNLRLYSLRRRSREVILERYILWLPRNESYAQVYLSRKWSKLSSYIHRCGHDVSIPRTLSYLSSFCIKISSRKWPRRVLATFRVQCKTFVHSHKHLDDSEQRLPKLGHASVGEVPDDVSTCPYVSPLQWQMTEIWFGLIRIGYVKLKKKMKCNALI